MCCTPTCTLGVGPFVVKLYVAGALVSFVVTGSIAVALVTDGSLTAKIGGQKPLTTLALLLLFLSLFFRFSLFFESQILSDRLRVKY